MSTLEKLYANYDLLSKAKDDSGENETAFKEILSAVKGDTKLKQLACQFIVKFYKKFPKLESKAIDAQLDLCEDEDQSIRRYAIKELPNFCRDNPENVSKIADILSQLLVTYDNVELVVVQGSLYQLLKANPKECLVGIFQQLANPSDIEDSSVREKTCKFVSSKLPTLSEKELDAEVEKYIVNTVKQLMVSADTPTFAGLLGILSVLKSMKLLTVRKQMIEVIESKAGVDKKASEFQTNKTIMSFYLCAEQAVPFFSKNVSSHKFVTSLCEKVLPSAMKKLSSGTVVADLPTKSQFMTLLAELSVNASSDQMTLVTVQHLFQILLDLMPSPPESLESGDAFANFPVEDLNLIECAIYSFHALSASHKDFFSAPESQARMADFRKRLQYLALGLQSHTKKLNEALKTKLDPDSDELKNKEETLLACKNISQIIRDLFRTPPQHTAQITLSWKAAAAAAKENAPQGGAASGVKRHAPISGPPKSESSNGVSASKMPRQLYRRNDSGRGRGGAQRGGARGGFRGAARY